MFLERIRDGIAQLMSGIRITSLRQCIPLLLLLIVVFYLFMGSACFWFFEHDHHEQSVRKWYMNLAVNRRHFARSISSRIFNDTRNLLIIIDREQSERVQQLLVESLKRYEDRVELQTPDRNEWTFLNSFNYAYSLLLTLGHGKRIPETTGGQIFALIYCIFGVPLLYGTITTVLLHCIKPLMSNRIWTLNRRMLLLQMVGLLYIVWNVLVAVLLHYEAYNDFWASIFTTFFSGMTIQVPFALKLSPCTLLILLIGSTVSISIIILGIFVAATAYCPTLGTG
ncbi:hypothetical protein KIN20_038184 [Parelaphostrongylus tenuis]|uniref:Potassium channel domain-containing protein n=1 Tax=Parelaphostrongylus tenuis TaxID=148309 RepID=A0AAD5RF43_PARTN|nr:hypothetical protein KIN20_038184 [Parelaphostrongylus tenuis]